MLEMKEWDGFEGRLWKEEINVRQFIQDNHTMETRTSSRTRQRQRISFGAHYRSYRKRSVPKAAFLIWRQRL